MRRATALALTATALLAGLTGCGSDDSRDTSTKTITRAEIEAAGKAWPFTSDKAELACKENAVTVTINGTVYALNGRAKDRKAGAQDLSPVWAENPDLPGGLKINVGDVIKEGLELC